MEKMGGVGKSMPITFSLFTAGAMASLALPGMSGFVGELSIFLGLTTSDVYSSNFKTIVIFLSAVGLMITPVYLLSMLRRVFFGQERDTVPIEPWLDIKPRELVIIMSFLIPIIGIGLYPKLATQSYDSTTVAVAAHLRDALPTIARVEDTSLYAQMNTLKMQETIAAPIISGKLVGAIDR